MPGCCASVLFRSIWARARLVSDFSVSFARSASIARMATSCSPVMLPSAVAVCSGVASCPSPRALARDLPSSAPPGPPRAPPSSGSPIFASCPPIDFQSMSALLHHLGQGSRPPADLFRPRRVQHLNRGDFVPAALHGRQSFHEPHQPADAHVEAHIREDHLPGFAHLPPPLAVAVQVVEDAQ